MKFWNRSGVWQTFLIWLPIRFLIALADLSTYELASSLLWLIHSSLMDHYTLLDKPFTIFTYCERFFTLPDALSTTFVAHFLINSIGYPLSVQQPSRVEFERDHDNSRVAVRWSDPSERWQGETSRNGSLSGDSVSNVNWTFLWALLGWSNRSLRLLFVKHVMFLCGVVNSYIPSCD